MAAEGIGLADQGNCAAAIDKLQRAETLYHAPTILGRLGECQVATGKVVMGSENLQRVVREPLPAKAPKAFVDAQARAQKVLDSAQSKVGKLRIHVDMPAGVKPVVKVDGESISLAALDVDRPADPGAHHIEAAAQGYRAGSCRYYAPRGRHRRGELEARGRSQRRGGGTRRSRQRPARRPTLRPLQAHRLAWSAHRRRPGPK